jgi:hypothetical protein
MNKARIHMNVVSSGINSTYKNNGGCYGELNWIAGLLPKAMRTSRTT